jgi:hypothetical protein
MCLCARSCYDKQRAGKAVRAPLIANLRNQKRHAIPPWTR